MTNSLTTRQKTEQRILAEIVAGGDHDDFIAAARRAADKAVADARALGWPESTIAGIPLVFATVAGELFADLVADAAAELLAERAAS